MRNLSATYAALTVAAVAAAVALPAAAATGTGSGGAAWSPEQTSNDDASAQQARNAEYRPAKATWYGPGLYGNKMACGKKLTRRTLGVAHKRLPCGTQVALKYRGRTVVVPVVDRGPFARGIDYDLTEATARKLGMRQTSRVGAAPLQ